MSSWYLISIDFAPIEGLHRLKFATTLSIISILGLFSALLVWLWPIGLGGSMPVGGDVTQFSIGLMAVLGEAIGEGRLPLWNDLWGYGFPGLAESQMGVFYPPHWILYGLLSVERAYTSSLVLHVLWGGLGTFWAARRFGVSPIGSALAGFAWGASGFYLIHLPHQWSYTVGSWMPWALGLAWGQLLGIGSRKDGWLLAAVLTLQVLPGHFQLAFCTQVGLLGMLVWSWVDRRSNSVQTLWRRTWTIGLALLAVAPLGALQLWPTFQLARLADAQRDYEYLSGFATTPLHLVNYIAPGLFHRSQLWRPLAWDPFHTSPEENLAYIGLIPLFLALGVIRNGWKRDPAVRALVVLAVGGLLLSLGPYVPGFSLYCQLPGFSFFRAPARWALLTELALVLLAGKGFDAIRTGDWTRPGRSLARFFVLALLWVSVVVGGFELALQSTTRPGWPVLADAYDRVFRMFPWEHDFNFRDVMANTRTPQGGVMVQVTQAREGLGPVPPSGLRLDRERLAIYRHELDGTALRLLGLLVLIPLASRRKLFLASLLVLTVIDLVALARHRPIDLGPIQPLTTQSVVLGRLLEEPRGTRIIDPSRNLPMLAGAVPVAAYRTLDLPIQDLLNRQAALLPTTPQHGPAIRSALQAIGAPIRVFSPTETASLPLEFLDALTPETYELLDDPELAAWLFGRAWVEQEGPWASQFLLWKPGVKSARAWLLPLSESQAFDHLAAIQEDQPEPILNALSSAQVLVERRLAPECLEVDLVVEAGDLPAAIVLTQLAHPDWKGTWRGPEGSQEASIVRVLGGWQGVQVPGPGTWTLQLRYDGQSVRIGLALSALAWLLWCLGFFWTVRQGRAKTVLQPSERSNEQ